jgi:PEGA domain
LLVGIAIVLALVGLGAWLFATKSASRPAAVPLRESSVQSAPTLAPQPSVALTPPAPAIAPSTPPATVALAKPILDLSSDPPDAQVLQNGVSLGSTPLRRDDLSLGEATFLLVKNGYLPRQLKAALQPGEVFKQKISLVRALPLYQGIIRVRNEPAGPVVPLAITMAGDLKSGTMTQSGKQGNFVVKFAGVWEGVELHAVTGEVVSQPAGIRWEPESFTLRFGDDGKTAGYECISGGKNYIADLSGQEVPAPAARPVYKGMIRPSNVPLTITLAADHKSGTMTQSGKAGDVVVRFNGIWDGPALRAVTGEVVSKPTSIKWDPESFILRFSSDGKTGTYECNSGGHTYTAELSAP